MKDWAFITLTVVLTLAFCTVFYACDDNTTYIVTPKHHDHGKGHHKLDGKVFCRDGDSLRWVEPEDCLWPCPESHGECPWPCVVNCGG